MGHAQASPDHCPQKNSPGTAMPAGLSEPFPAKITLQSTICAFNPPVGGLKPDLLLRSFGLAVRLAVKQGRHAALTMYFVKHILHYGPKIVDFLQ